MIWYGNGRIQFEPDHDEPRLRSCWECNPAHERLRDSAYIHCCFDCGKYWVLGWDFGQDATEEEFDAHFAARGLKPGDSTTKIDSPSDGIVVIEIRPADGCN